MGKSTGSGTMRALGWVELLCAAFGFIGGVMFFVDPSGKTYGLDAKLDRLPVADFLLVGVWLFVVYGVGFGVARYGLGTRHSWAWPLGLGLSVVWIAWIGVETALWGPDPFILMWLVPPVLALVLLLQPGTREEMRSRDRVAQD